ncbi:hypothetical protein KKC22_17570 [Myxococcota bacterium]|nr:hypothetical protein [Myxococcota bacterium]
MKQEPDKPVFHEIPGITDLHDLTKTRRLLLFMDFDTSRKGWNGWEVFQKLKQSQLDKIQYLFDKWLTSSSTELRLTHDEFHNYGKQYPDCVSFKMIKFKVRFHGFLCSILSPGVNLQVCILTHHEKKNEDKENDSILSAIAGFRAKEFDAQELRRFLQLK